MLMMMMMMMMMMMITIMGLVCNDNYDVEKIICSSNNNDDNDLDWGVLSHEGSLSNSHP